MSEREGAELGYPTVLSPFPSNAATRKESTSYATAEPVHLTCGGRSRSLQNMNVAAACPCNNWLLPSIVPFRNIAPSGDPAQSRRSTGRNPFERADFAAPSKRSAPSGLPSVLEQQEGGGEEGRKQQHLRQHKKRSLIRTQIQRRRSTSAARSCCPTKLTARDAVAGFAWRQVWSPSTSAVQSRP